MPNLLANKINNRRNLHFFCTAGTSLTEFSVHTSAWDKEKPLLIERVINLSDWWDHHCDRDLQFCMSIEFWRIIFHCWARNLVNGNWVQIHPSSYRNWIVFYVNNEYICFSSCRRIYIAKKRKKSFNRKSFSKQTRRFAM